jgi:replicative DNA helicase
MAASNTTNFINEKQDFSKFGSKFQEQLIQLMLEDRVFFDQITEVLDPNFLELKYLRVFLELIIDYRKKYSTHPTRDNIIVMLRTGLDKESEVTQKQIRDFFGRVETSEPTQDGVQFIKDTALDFCRKQKLKEAMIKCVGLIQNSSFDEISKTMETALKLGSDNNHGHDYLLDFEKRFLFTSRSPVSTGWDYIDNITKGGLGKKELGVVVAPTGAGKSMVLVHLGAKALQAGLNVVHYTLELGDTVVGTRYDSCITGIPFNDIIDKKEMVYDTVKEVKGRLIIKEYPPKTASTVTIKNHLDKLRRQGNKIDMVIVDYGDLIKPSKAEKEKRNELESIYEELRAIAQIFECPVYTASQTNRSGLNAEVVTMESIAEAFNKCFVADFIFSLSRTVNDKNANTGRFFIAKNRNGPDGLVFPIHMNTGNVSISVLEQSQETVEQMAANSMQAQEKSLKDKYRQFKKERKTKGKSVDVELEKLINE